MSTRNTQDSYQQVLRMNPEGLSITVLCISGQPVVGVKKFPIYAVIGCQVVTMGTGNINDLY